MLRYKLKTNILYFVKLKFLKPIYQYICFLRDYYRLYSSRHSQRFHLSVSDWYPCLGDATSTTPFDAHYTYHPAWAIRRIVQVNPAVHVDFSSLISFSANLSAFLPVVFYDYRPVDLSLSNLSCRKEDITKLESIEDASLLSISCMHTVEHIGLGRYGDPIDYDADIKAIEQLKRICAPNGHIYFVTPVGQPKIMFNAHRIYSYEMVIDLFAGFELLEFSMVYDNGDFIDFASPKDIANQKYGCGCFIFKNTL